MLLPGTTLKNAISTQWNHYVALIDVAEENARLRDEASRTEHYLASVHEDLAELGRLRALLGIAAPDGWNTLGTRVIAGRFGPGSSLETLMIDRGFASGAAVGTPLATHKGLVGRVFRAAPHIATVLLITDQTFKVPVITSESRVPGVLVGGGPRAWLEVRYVAPNASVSVGETLVTSGIEGSCPKGIPVARVVSVEPGTQTLFQHIQAEPFASLESVEEALLLVAPRNWPLNSTMPDSLSAASRGADNPAPKAPPEPTPGARPSPHPSPPQGARTTPSRATP